VDPTIRRVYDACRLRYASRIRMTRTVPAVRHVIPRWAGSCQEVTVRVTIAVNASGRTYRHTRASPPLRRTSTREIQERSSYHRLALRKRFYPTAKRSSPAVDVPEKNETSHSHRFPPCNSGQLRSATFKNTPLPFSDKIGGASMYADDANQQRAM